MDIAVTGASGHLGAALCRQLLADGHQLRVLVRSDARALDGLPVRSMNGTLEDAAVLENLVEGADVVFHLAGQISIGAVPEQILWRTNVGGTANVIQACQNGRVKRLIHFSSVHAFQPVAKHLVFDESAPPATMFPYERSKAAAQRLVQDANGHYGLETVCLNPTAVLGPWDFKPSLQGKMMLDLLARRIPILTPGGFDWVDSRDVARAAAAAITRGKPGVAYLLSGSFASMVELTKILGGISGRPMPRRTLPFRILRGMAPFIQLWSRINGTEPLFTVESLSHVEAGHPSVSHARARQDLGYMPRPLEETVRDMYEWLTMHYLSMRKTHTQ
ncbi:MAG: NAD-dependent epimerase/dehydratase family protein [Bacteroidetes bacterium]|nr:MAG: NAD-dependent epimerase/dehydratase family protein [Bacteroidota bacterium]